MGQAKLKGNISQRIDKLLSAHSLKLLSKERYDAFASWTKSPSAGMVGEEVDYYSSVDEVLIGTIVKDKTDSDFGYVILGRDEKGRFRCIECKVSMSRTEARHALFHSMKSIVDSKQTVFSQGDEDLDKAGLDLFTPVAVVDKQHPAFRYISKSDHFIPARAILSEMMRHLTDVDGNFVEQFQTTGFDSRTWELYLYAALLELGLFVEKPSPAPDFSVSLGNQKVFIEAVTVNATGNVDPPKPEEPVIERTPEEVKELLDTKIPIKFASSLWSKLNRDKPYWEMESVKGYPLVFAIADFHEKQSMAWSSTALINYLYGVSHEFNYDKNGRLIITPEKIQMHEYNGKIIPSGFFLQQKSENISAVLFSSSGTISKFNRMGKLAGFGLSNQKMIRVGFRHLHDDNASFPEYFHHEIEPGKVNESWAEGLSMFHNPHAKQPINWEMFYGIAHHFYEDGHIKSLIPKFHPYSSYTWNIMPAKED